MSRLRIRVRLGVAAIAAVAIALGGCGPTPPQAPRLQAQKLDESLAAIAAACGEAAQVTAFAGDHRADLATLTATASAKASEVASVYAHNPAWVYQGETVRAIVDDAVSMLHECGLGEAARVLEVIRSQGSR